MLAELNSGCLPACTACGAAGVAATPVTAQPSLLHACLQAINPLAESLPNSARSTPRDLGADAPPPAAPLQQQYHAAQQYGQQLPPGPSLSRPSSFGQLAQHAQQAPRGPSREGSFRGGLAGLAGKMMGSPIDRLRRLSSGHYQQQAGQQHQPRY